LMTSSESQEEMVAASLCCSRKEALSWYRLTLISSGSRIWVESDR
jgi:hypothetical protein